MVARRLQVPAELGDPFLQLRHATGAACGIPVEASGELGDDVLIALGRAHGVSSGSATSGDSPDTTITCGRACCARSKNSARPALGDQLTSVPARNGSRAAPCTS